MTDHAQHDALAAALASVRLRGAVFGRGTLARDWGVSSAGLPHILYLVLIGGSADLTVRARRRIERRLSAGDTLVLRAGTAFELRAALGCPVIPFEAYVERLSRAARGGSTAVLCGSVELDPIGQTLFGASLPPLIQLAAGSGAGRLSETLVAEVVSPRPGSSLVQTRLAELLFLEAVRSCVEGELRGWQVTGWLRGLQHPTIARGLAAIHALPERGWTVESLAAHSGSSRSTFARTFRSTVGVTPLAYLATWRLRLAARALEEGSQTIRAIAQAAGYGSDEAFSRAFRAWSGTSPGRYRRQHMP